MTRTQPRTRGSSALKQDFGGAVSTSTVPVRSGHRVARMSLRLATGPDKYKVLEHRRRQAQIKARHLLDLMEEN